MKIRRYFAIFALFCIMLGGCVFADPGPPHNGEFFAVNNYRTARGIPATLYDTDLEAMAQDWANYLCDTGQFHHRDLNAALYQYGGWNSLGEVMLDVNGGTLDFNTVLAFWDKSPGHKAAILNGTYTVIGIGHRICGTRDIWVMDLGAR